MASHIPSTHKWHGFRYVQAGNKCYLSAGVATCIKFRVSRTSEFFFSNCQLPHCTSYRVTSRHYPYFVQDRQDATTNNSHCFTRRSQVRPQCGFIGRSPYTVQHLYYKFSTTVLLPPSYYYSHCSLSFSLVLPRSPRLHLISCLYSRRFTYINIGKVEQLLILPTHKLIYSLGLILMYIYVNPQVSSSTEVKSLLRTQERDLTGTSFPCWTLSTKINR